jgi:hypothetical protein
VGFTVSQFLGGVKWFADSFDSSREDCECIHGRAMKAGNIPAGKR